MSGTTPSLSKAHIVPSLARLVCGAGECEVRARNLEAAWCRVGIAGRDFVRFRPGEREEALAQRGRGGRREPLGEIDLLRVVEGRACGDESPELLGDSRDD